MKFSEIACFVARRFIPWVFVQELHIIVKPVSKLVNETGKKRILWILPFYHGTWRLSSPLYRLPTSVGFDVEYQGLLLLPKEFWPSWTPACFSAAWANNRDEFGFQARLPAFSACFIEVTKDSVNQKETGCLVADVIARLRSLLWNAIEYWGRCSEVSKPHYEPIFCRAAFLTRT